MASTACVQRNKKPDPKRELCPLLISRLCHNSSASGATAPHYTHAERERPIVDTMCGVRCCPVCVPAAAAEYLLLVCGCVCTCTAVLVVHMQCYGAWPAGQVNRSSHSISHWTNCEAQTAHPHCRRVQPQEDRSPAQQTDRKPFVTACTSLHGPDRTPKCQQALGDKPPPCIKPGSHMTRGLAGGTANACKSRLPVAWLQQAASKHMWAQTLTTNAIKTQHTQAAPHAASLSIDCRIAPAPTLERRRHSLSHGCARSLAAAGTARVCHRFATGHTKKSSSKSHQTVDPHTHTPCIMKASAWCGDKAAHQKPCLGGTDTE